MATDCVSYSRRIRTAHTLTQVLYLVRATDKKKKKNAIKCGKKEALTAVDDRQAITIIRSQHEMCERIKIAPDMKRSKARIYEINTIQRWLDNPDHYWSPIISHRFYWPQYTLRINFASVFGWFHEKLSHSRSFYNTMKNVHLCPRNSLGVHFFKWLTRSYRMSEHTIQIWHRSGRSHPKESEKKNKMNETIDFDMRMRDFRLIVKKSSCCWPWLRHEMTR